MRKRITGRIPIPYRRMRTMLNRKYVRIISALTAAVMLLLVMTGCGKKNVTENQIILDATGKKKFVQTEYETIAENTDVRKQETVYVNLAPDGTVNKVSVTDWLHTSTPQVRIVDTSTLTDIKNVKSLTAPIIQDQYLIWDMDTTDLYYSGVTDKQPPVSFEIKYYMDGEEVPYENMAGETGQVTIQIKVNNNLTGVVNADGKEYTISCPMLMVGGMILSEEKFSNVTVQNGTALGDGTKQIVFFAGVPGMDKSLGLSALNLSLLNPQLLSDTYTITADVVDFALGNMMFAVLPFSAIGSIGNGELPETVDEVKGVLTDIQSLQTALNGLDLERIITLLYGDSDKIGDMLDAISDAVKLYNENEKLIKTIDKYMTDDNLNKLDVLINDINETDINAISRTLSDPAMQNLMSWLPSLSASLTGLSTLANDLNEVMPMLQGMNNDMQDPEIQQSLERLPQTLAKLKEILAVIDENRDLLDALGAFASGDNEAQLQSVMDTAKKYLNTDELSEKEMQTLAGRTREWLNFGMNYSIFTQKVEGNSSSVIFTYKSEAISKAKQ